MFSRVIFAMTFAATQPRKAATSTSTTAWITKARHASEPCGSAKRARRGGGKGVVVPEAPTVIPAKPGVSRARAGTHVSSLAEPWVPALASLGRDDIFS